MYTVTTYEMEDYDNQRNEVDSMSPKVLASAVRGIARGWLPDYNFTGDESDFYHHKQKMIMSRVAEILEQMK